MTKEGGRQEMSEPRYTEPPAMGLPKDEAEIVKVPGAPTPDTHGMGDDDMVHLMHWLDAMRDRREPNATVDHGFVAGTVYFDSSTGSAATVVTLTWS